MTIELEFNRHINEKVNKTNRTMAVSRRAFNSLDETNFLDAIENVQRRGTKQLPGMKDLEYPDRLKKLGLPTLAYRRVRWAMINRRIKYYMVNMSGKSPVC